MARNGTWLVAVLALSVPAVAEDSLAERWDTPGRESFALKEALPEAAAQAIRSRFGHDVKLFATYTRAADFDARDVTFFEALDLLAGTYGLCLVGGAPKGEMGATQELALVQPSSPVAAAAVSYIGASRLSVDTVTTLGVSLHVPVGWTEEDPPRLRLRLKWIVEPGFEGAAITEMKLTEVVDDRGRRVVQKGHIWLPVPANSRVVVDFERPSGATSLRRLAGTATVTLPVANGEVAFANTDVGTTKSLGGATIKLDRVDGATVGLTVVGTPCGIEGTADAVEILVRPDLYAKVAGIEDVTLVPYDAAGRELAAETWETSSQGATHAYEIGLDGAPVRFVFRGVVRATTREAPFAFADVPLPE